MAAIHKVRIIKTGVDALVLSIGSREMSINWEKLSQRLKKASQVERSHIEISQNGYGLHWPLIDEDLSVDGILRDFSDSSPAPAR